MKHHYLLWASGADRSGIVAAVTGALFDHGMNLEDSAMMRLGSEFGIFLIFSANRDFACKALENDLMPIGRKLALTIGVKKISARQASARPREKRRYIVSVHGPDRPGIVSRVTERLAKYSFNITDLVTHRTTSGKSAGYILFIEGELRASSVEEKIRRELNRLQKALKTRMDIRPVESQTF